MARVVIPDLVTLRLGSLPDAVGRYAQVEQKLGPLLRKRKHDTREPGIPVSLRWTVNPALGFPRAAFEVWRRTRNEEPAAALLGAATPAAPSTVDLPNAAIEVRFDASPGPGGLIVEALNAVGKVLPGQRLQFTTSTPGRFRAPGISKLRLTGGGSIGGVLALLQNDWANLADWERIEVVGFPFDAALLATSGYDGSPQGWEPASQAGPDAATIRMVMAELLQGDPPPPGGAFTTPAWPFPDPGAFLAALGTTLADVADCLSTSVDADPQHLQAGHSVSRQLPGLHQPGQTPGDPATIELSTTAYVALAVQDAPVAVGLGFGTIDVPQISRPPQPKDLLPAGTELGRDEYMVTATWETPVGTFEIAAIGHRESAPPGLAGVAAEVTFANRAVTRDAPESRAIAIAWTSPLLQAGAAILARSAGGTGGLFNTPRPAGSGGFQPYLTEYRIADDGFPPAGLRPGVTLPDEVVPVAGTAVSTYAVAPLDVHGRWGPWTIANHSLSAPAVQQPGIGAVSLDLPAVLPASGPIATGCTLVAEVSWDWSDRSPSRIELSGAFVPAGPPPAAVSGFQPDATQAAVPLPLTIAFSLAGVPSIAVPPAGSPPAAIALAQGASVTEISQAGVTPGAPAPGATDQVRRYRVTVPDITVSFTTASVIGFAVSARAAEVVRPTELSATTGPRATSVHDPFPAPPPTLPAVTVLWTAQPDAAGRARTVLSWPSVPGASGYFIWEATETALSVAVGGTPATGALPVRAADLKARVAANQDASLSAFSRLNETALTTTSTELVLPGSADTLFAYRIASITSQNVESARSTDIVLVGVPRRDVPGTPHLDAVATDGGVLLSIVPGVGAPPAKLRLHRVRRQSLSGQVGTMGPTVLSVATAGLTKAPLPVLSGPPQSGWQFLDPVDPSWTPYYYRCVAVGRDAHSDGVFAGDSPPSGAISVLVTPPLPPLLTVDPAVQGPAGVLVTLRTDLPVALTPVGSAVLRLSVVSGTTRSAIATLDPAGIATGAALVATGAPVTEVQTTRRAPIAGTSEITVLFPATLRPAGSSVVVNATDPVGRSTSFEVG